MHACLVSASLRQHYSPSGPACAPIVSHNDLTISIVGACGGHILQQFSNTTLPSGQALQQLLCVFDIYLPTLSSVYPCTLHMAMNCLLSCAYWHKNLWQSLHPAMYIFVSWILMEVLGSLYNPWVILDGLWCVIHRNECFYCSWGASVTPSFYHDNTQLAYTDAVCWLSVGPPRMWRETGAVCTLKAKASWFFFCTGLGAHRTISLICISWPSVALLLGNL